MINLSNQIYDLSYHTDQKNLISAIEEEIYQNDIEDYEQVESLIQQITIIINAGSDSELLKLQGELYNYYNVWITQITESELIHNALTTAGYTVDCSKYSSSIYAQNAQNDQNKEIRISDHKRPNVVTDNFISYEHEPGLILQNKEIKSDKLIALGFSKLPKNKMLYLL